MAKAPGHRPLILLRWFLLGLLLVATAAVLRIYLSRDTEPPTPRLVADDPASGLLPRISAEPPGENGQGDHRVQAYCYRMCLTDVPQNRVPFAKPEGYDPGQYELLARVFATGWRETFRKFDPIPNHKTDTNNHGPFSTDNIGMNYDYPEATYERRREILREIRIEEDRFGFEPEITAKVAKLGCRIYEVGISYAGRTYVEGKKIGWRDGIRAIWCILKYNLLR